MIKSLAAATLASYTAAQSADVTNYSVTTGTLQNLAKTADVATTSFGMVFEELVDGANSSTVMEQTFNFSLVEGTTWSTDENAFVQMVACYPYTNGASAAVYNC